MTDTTDNSNIQFADGRLAVGIDEFCTLAGLGRTSVYDAIKDGSLVARKRGGRTLILAADGVRFLNGLPALKARGSSGSAAGKAA